MLPEYLPGDMWRLADEWFVASKKNNISSEEAEALFEKTNKIFTYLKSQDERISFTRKNSSRSYSEREAIAKKIIYLCDIFMGKFNNLPEKEITSLAQWVAEHTGRFKPQGNYIIEHPGAFDSLHKIVEIMKKIKTGNFIAAEDQWTIQNNNLALVDSKSKLFIQDAPKVEYLTHPDIKKGVIFPNLDLKNLMTMRATSQENKIIVNELLIQALNEQYIAYQDIHISNFDDIISFFDKQASKLTFLNLNIVSTDTDERIAYIIEYCPNISHITLTGDVKVTEQLLENFACLNKLSLISFKDFNDIDAFQIIMNIFPNLTYISLEDFDTIEDVSILNDCHNLKELKLINCPNLKTLVVENDPASSIGDAIYFPLLEYFEMKDCPNVTDFKFLLNCPALKTVTLKVSLHNEQAIIEHLEVYDALKNKGIDIINEIIDLTA